MPERDLQMSKKNPAELNDLEQPMEELTPEQAEQVEGGIIVVCGKLPAPPGNPVNTGIPGNPI